MRTRDVSTNRHPTARSPSARARARFRDILPEEYRASERTRVVDDAGATARFGSSMTSRELIDDPPRARHDVDVDASSSIERRARSERRANAIADRVVHMVSRAIVRGKDDDRVRAFRGVGRIRARARPIRRRTRERTTTTTSTARYRIDRDARARVSIYIYISSDASSPSSSTTTRASEGVDKRCDASRSRVRRPFVRARSSSFDVHARVSIQRARRGR